MENKDETKPETEYKRTECEVCQMLMKEKHRNDYVWKVLCVCFLAIAIILAILYFSSGAIKTETTYEFNDSVNDNQIQGDGNIVVGGEDTNIDAKSTSYDYTPIVCITIIFAAVVIVVGGIIIANHNKKDD